MVKPNKEQKIQEILTRNVEQVIDKNHLEQALCSGKKLRVKLGIDPTGTKIHIGRAVALWKLRAFQELGHKIVLIVGDFTALVGDPSDKTGKRPMLSRKQVKENLKNYLPQIGKIIDLKKAEVRYNSEWLGKLDFNEIAGLADNFSVQQMIERRNFKDRWDKHEEISMREFMYPLMQGYDSVAIKADVELGGTDQLFNLMAGRKIQERYGQKPQDVMTMGMIMGLDGRKMSTSWGNVINIIDPPEEQYGKIMSMHDNMMMDYFRFATDISESEIRKYHEALHGGKNPKEIKSILAQAIVARYHGAKAAKAAAEKWEKIFSQKEASSGELKELRVGKKQISAAELVLLSGVTKSKSEAWRLVVQGGLKINNVAEKSPKSVLNLKKGDVVRVGKKSYFRIK
ncbi:MAG: tyrosine--tRNA ligase [Candidatus Liptonbacteria bacterium]